MLRFALIAFALAAAAPASAADVATLGCLGGKISTDLRNKVSASYAARLADPGIPLDHVLDDQIVVFGDQCRAQYGWSEAERNSAIAWTRASIALPAAEKFARANGIDVDAIWKIWDASPVSRKGTRLEDSELSILGDALQTAGLFKKPGDPAVIGKLLAYKNTTDFARKEFIGG